MPEIKNSCLEISLGPGQSLTHCSACSALLRSLCQLQDPRGWLTFARDQAEDVPQFYGDCSQHDFQAFKNRSIDWYEKRMATLNLFHDMTLLVNNFHTIYKNCPPAALLAVLLKLESMYFEDEEKWKTLLEIYVNAQHQASAQGDLFASHYAVDRWPLQQGIAHALALRRQGGTARSLELVVCYCSEKLSWLRAFHRLPWRDEDRSEAVQKQVALRFYHKCGAMTSAARAAEAQRLVEAWASTFREVSVRYVDDVLRADDDSAYLAFIVDRYDTLPDYTVFLHADAPEHVPSLELLTDTVFAAIRGYLSEKIGFVHFAHNYVLHDLGCRNDAPCEGRQLEPEFATLWKKVFRSSLAPSLAAGDVNAYCCVQFMVHRDRIRLRPRAFYQNGWDYFGLTAESYHRLFPVGRALEPWTDGVVSKGVEPVKGLDQRSRMVGGSTFRHLGALRFWGAMVEDSVVLGPDVSLGGRNHREVVGWSGGGGWAAHLDSSVAAEPQLRAEEEWKMMAEEGHVARVLGGLAMYIWHVMFGEPLKLPRRQRDLRLPLFMKIQNVEALGVRRCSRPRCSPRLR
ncbi:Uncharacterized protein SCF082_LOCUS6068 [Durusdinium trenchii]|uniref:Uncharacterized protein n=1 Tax=Durusdinium trenchii TaxID=1381693 RepID=A0ABP0IDM9_9DINO